MKTWWCKRKHLTRDLKINKDWFNQRFKKNGSIGPIWTKQSWMCHKCLNLWDCLCISSIFNLALTKYFPFFTNTFFCMTIHIKQLKRYDYYIFNNFFPTADSHTNIECHQQFSTTFPAGYQKLERIRSKKAFEKLQCQDNNWVQWIQYPKEIVSSFHSAKRGGRKIQGVNRSSLFEYIKFLVRILLDNVKSFSLIQSLTLFDFICFFLFLCFEFVRENDFTSCMRLYLPD